MKETKLSYASYWRKSLLDADSGKGAFKDEPSLLKDTKKRPLKEVETGYLDIITTDELFLGEPKDMLTVSITFQPQVYLARKIHLQAPTGGIPGIITPIISNANVDRSGRIYPESTFIARDLLEPLDRGSFAISDVSSLDIFLTKNSFSVSYDDFDEATSSESRDDWFKSRWAEYVSYCEKLIEEVTTKDAFAQFEIATYFFIVKKDQISASMHIRALYADIINNKITTPLFEQYISNTIDAPEQCLVPNALFSVRLAHSGDRFHLAAAQRDALNHLLSSKNGDILAVNGPPGTGKTTLLLSVVASAWANAAIDGGNPPVIFACSTNNQAVTNIIEAFEKDFAKGEGVFAGRWLPDINSFGAYFPSQSKEAEASIKYQTKLFFDDIEKSSYIEKAEESFITAAKNAFSNLTDYSIQSIVKSLQNSIRLEAEKLKEIQNAWAYLESSKKNLFDELGSSPAEEMNKRKSHIITTQIKLSELDSLTTSWEAYLAAEPLYLSLFSWIPPIKTKRLLLARQFLKKSSVNNLDSITAMSSDIAEQFKQTKILLENFKVDFERGERKLQAIAEGQLRWEKAVLPLKTSIPASDLTLQQCDDLADITIRFLTFQLTTHYWEGRWLMAIKDLLAENGGDLNKEKSKTGESTLKKRWYRRMMLTPCAVSTFFMLPKLLLAQRYNEGIFDDNYLYDFADLLIVDEAGQVLPEVAGASFSLAKKAIVIGDTKQIEPIWAITKQIDIGNLITANLLPANYNQDSYKKLTALGKNASSGSVMLIAQHATRYHYDQELDRGMFLFEHRRCFDEIISFCDELCYSKKLLPKRGSCENKSGLPAMGYLQVDGISQNSNGSRKNELEAETIAEWLIAHQELLESTYEKTLSQIVGIVVPFTGQVRAITYACKSKGINVDKNNDGLTIGTIHSLQGAERSVVIFSPTYSKHADGKFIDRSASMLNVAVSRAKDSFLVFGDMDIFNAESSGTPRNLLAKYLFKNDSNALRFKRIIRKDLKVKQNSIRQLINAEDHDLFLLETINHSKNEVIIVTPWLLKHAISDQLINTMRVATLRGVSITVYTDASFNKPRQKEMHLAIDLLKTIGVETLLLNNVHSKVIICDESTYCAGSFNWFSADRQGQFKNYEVSIVYQGDDLIKEVDIIKKDLSNRVITT